MSLFPTASRRSATRAGLGACAPPALRFSIGRGRGNRNGARDDAEIEKPANFET
jgi:hypothetical protein